MGFGTVTGEEIDVLNITEDNINIIDIATGLSYICRFNGQVDVPYTVAQHSLRVAAMVPERLQLAALMHDASEAYTCDLVSPIKHDPSMHAFVAIEDKIQAMIAKKYGFPARKHPSIHRADKICIYFEEKEIRRYTHIEAPFDNMPDYLDIPVAVPINKARELFIEHFSYLTGKL